MQERHLDKEKYFNEQVITTQKYVIPFLNELMDINENTSVLEIGCGEAGNLKPFLNIGCKRVVGVDLSEHKVGKAKEFFSTHPNKNNLELLVEDIYNVANTLGQFDLIIARDVIEHIHGQERFLKVVKNNLSPEGKFFLGFPPWYNPFGGHQQMCENKFLSKMPFFHILPIPLYRNILKIFGEKESRVNELLEIKETGITIERFEKILKKAGYKRDKRTFYLINPNYETKFGLKPKEQLKLLSTIPFLRNFYITANYYVISNKNGLIKKG
jgi:SAM-dependent methyltransferase